MKVWHVPIGDGRTLNIPSDTLPSGEVIEAAIAKLPPIEPPPKSNTKKSIDFSKDPPTPLNILTKLATFTPREAPANSTMRKIIDFYKDPNAEYPPDLIKKVLDHQLGYKPRSAFTPAFWRGEKGEPDSLRRILGDATGDAISWGIPGYKFASPATKVIPKLAQWLGSQGVSSTASGTGAALREAGKGASGEEATKAFKKAALVDAALGGAFGLVGEGVQGFAKFLKSQAKIPDAVWERATNMKNLKKVPTSQKAADETAKRASETTMKVKLGEKAARELEATADFEKAEKAESVAQQLTQDFRARAQGIKEKFYGLKPSEKEMVAHIPPKTISKVLNAIKKRLRADAAKETEPGFKTNPEAEETLKKVNELVTRQTGGGRAKAKEIDPGIVTMGGKTPIRAKTLNKPETLLNVFNILKDEYKGGTGRKTAAEKSVNDIYRSVRSVLFTERDKSGYLDNLNPKADIPTTYKQQSGMGQTISSAPFKALQKEGVGETFLEYKPTRKALEEATSGSASQKQFMDAINIQSGPAPSTETLAQSLIDAKNLKTSQEKLKKIKAEIVEPIPQETIDQWVLNPDAHKSKIDKYLKKNKDLIEDILNQEAARAIYKKPLAYRQPMHGDLTGTAQKAHMALEGMLSIFKQPHMLLWFIKNRKGNKGWPPVEVLAKIFGVVARKEAAKTASSKPRNYVPPKVIQENKKIQALPDGSYSQTTTQNIKNKRVK